MAHTLPRSVLHRQQQESEWTRDIVKEMRKREQQHRLWTVTLCLSLFLSLSALSPWCTHVDLEQGCILAGVARSRERRGWIDGDGVCGGIKGYGASIAEQVQGLIGSGNGWSM